mgnify:CR=1 FL=1
MIQDESNISPCHQYNKSKSHKCQEMGKKNDVSPEKRQDVFHRLLSLCKKNVLPRGAMSLVSEKENISRWSVNPFTTRPLKLKYEF